MVPGLLSMSIVVKLADDEDEEEEGAVDGVAPVASAASEAQSCIVCAGIVVPI